MLGSPVDLAIVGVVVLLVFGPKKVPELGKALGQGIGNFKRALTDATEEVKTGMTVEDKPATKADDISAAPTPAPASTATQSETPSTQDDKAVPS